MRAAHKLKSTANQPVRGTYAELAAEYYNQYRHPTCANFRLASRLYFERCLDRIPGRASDVICEVGAGLSLFAEVYANRGQKLDSLILSDASHEMLRHSAKFELLGAKLVVADARQSCFDEGSIALVASSLGDPYNTEEFWAETRRILRKGGTVIFTTPSSSWAKEFRKSNDPAGLYSAEFVTANGDKILVPSYIFPEADQIALIRSHGFSIVDVHQITVGQINDLFISPKLITSAGNDQPILTGYLAYAI